MQLSRRGHTQHGRSFCSLSHHARPALPRTPHRQGAQLIIRRGQCVRSSSARAEGASTDVQVLLKRLGQLALPYWTDPEAGGAARWKLAGVVGLTLATTGVSVLFNFLGRDFFNALSEKNEAEFGVQLVRYLGGFLVGVPVFVFKGYYQSRLALEWRTWVTQRLMADYFSERTFFSLQAQASVDNPDQRIASDAADFTGSALNLALVLLTAGVDLVSFSGILYSIYPPLFLALIVYSATGTAISVALGKPLVGLNFAQEAREADLRYGLVRVRENAEAVAFYRGEADESSLLTARLKAAVENYLGLLVATRNLDFFTSFYRYIIQLLPAAVVAPLFFRGEIEFGVINQSQSAFNHVLNDLSLVVYQLNALAGFSAVVDRLGQFQEAMGASKPPLPPLALPPGTSAGPPLLLQLSGLSVLTPDRSSLLVKDLDLEVLAGASLLIMGPSGAGKTSILRAVAGLWSAGAGNITILVTEQDIMFLPQKPYMVLGSLRDQVLYPRYPVDAEKAAAAMVASESGPEEAGAAEQAADVPAVPMTPPAPGPPADVPDDARIVATLRSVRLGHLLSRYAAKPNMTKPSGSLTHQGATQQDDVGDSNALDAIVDWSSSLSLGEQQRLAWARLLLTRPRLALLDEASSALDATTEAELYQVLAKSGITYISVGHRPTLRQYHAQVLQLSPAQGGAAQASALGSRTMAWELQSSG
ncbi:ABC transporter transmembrane region 2-domain-containing protein [Haematococcus lacustris]